MTAVYSGASHNRFAQKCVPNLDAVAARTIGFEEKPDAELLARALADDRVVLTHDVQTMSAFAIARVRNGQATTGLLVVPQRVPIGRAIEELTMAVLCSDQSKGAIASFICSYDPART
jgi:hypothetical protein